VIPRENDLRHAYVDLAPASKPATLRSLASTLFWHRWRRWTLPLNATFAQPTPDGPEAPPFAYRRESMANLNASVANSLMQSLAENLAARRVRARRYQDVLGGVAGLRLIPHRPGSACLTQVVQISPGRGGHDLAAEIISTLGRAGFEIQGSYVPIHLLGHYPQCVWDRLPNAERIWADLIELPCEPSVGLDHVAQIASMVKGVICD
jgi:dTDP-4-amino-4,6-dideoxygalactose transaminase